MTRSQPHSERQQADLDIGVLIASFRKGDAQAFDALYAMYQSRIYRFCRRMMGDDVLAKDAFQETFIKMYEHRAEAGGGVSTGLGG